MEQFPKDIIVASKKLQQFFKQRCVELDVSPELIAKKANVDFKKLTSWIESVDPDSCSISQECIVKMFHLMHVNVTLAVGVVPVNVISEEELNELRADTV
jgi:hypothetical protein